MHTGNLGMIWTASYSLRLLRVLSSILAFGLASACNDGSTEQDETDVAKRTVAPWAMWGNSQTVELVGLAGTQTNATTQIVNVQYGRPETWNFLFTAKLLSVQPDVLPTGVNIFFDVAIGLGRSQTTIQAFETYQFSWLAGAGSVLVGKTYRTTSVIVPFRGAFSSAADPYPTVPNTIDHLVAQTIQVDARVTMAPALGERLVFELGAYFAPQSHVRPEWFEGRFPGGEDNGT